MANNSSEIALTGDALSRLLEAAFDAGSRFEVWRNMTPDKTYAMACHEFVEKTMTEVDESDAL